LQRPRPGPADRLQLQGGGRQAHGGVEAGQSLSRRHFRITSGSTFPEQMQISTVALPPRSPSSFSARFLAAVLTAPSPYSQATPYALLSPTASASQPAFTQPTTFASVSLQLASAARSAAARLP